MDRTTKRRWAMIGAGALSFVLLGCSQPGVDPAQPTAAPSGDATSVGVVLSFTDFFYNGVQRAMDGTAGPAGAEVLYSQTQADPGKESDAIANFISRKVSAIAVAPVGGEASVASLQAAADAGIPVICYDGCVPSDIGPTVSKAYVQSDQYALGEQTGKAMKEYITAELGGTAKIATLNCNVFVETCGKRFQGMKDALADLPGVEFVADQEAYVPDKGQTVAENMLTANPDLNILWASNEGGTVGAVNAVVSQSRGDRVKVFGTDISPQVAEFLKDSNGVLLATTGQDADEMGRIAMELALKAAAGEEISPWLQVIPVAFYDRADVATIDEYLQKNS